MKVKFYLGLLLAISFLLAGCASTQAPGETVHVTRLPATADLNTLLTSDFQPDLALLDAVIQSPRVEPNIDLNAPPAQQLPPVLLAHDWQLAAAGVESADMFLPVPPAWLRFSADIYPNNNADFSFEGFSGCNTLFGSYVVVEKTLMMDVGQTEQDCGADFMAFENLMLEILRNNPSFNLLSENAMFYLILQQPDNESNRMVFRAVDGP